MLEMTSSQIQAQLDAVRIGRLCMAATDGRPYEARDPALLLWVQATLVLTSLRLYEAIAGPLSMSERDAYWTEAKPIAEALGIPLEQQPASLADLRRYERSMLATDVRPDETSRRVARQVLRPFGWVPAPVYWPNDALTAALVPAALRAPLGLRYRARERVFVAGVIAAVRILRTALPSAVTVVPQARRFERWHGR